MFAMRQKRFVANQEWNLVVCHSSFARSFSQSETCLKYQNDKVKNLPFFSDRRTHTVTFITTWKQAV